MAGRWKTLDIGFGLQDGHDGAVRFLIHGDGKELFRSDAVMDHEERRRTVSVDGVKQLELEVESAASGGNSGAWGVWTRPILKR